MTDSGTTITADNASSVVKSSYDDVNNALEGLLGNINTSGNSSNTPVWVPQPCPFANAPTGYILANGASFSASQYPQLGAAFPSGKVPDLRGLFIRGLDTTGTIDRDGVTRQLLSFQEGSFLLNDYGANVCGFGTNFNLSQTPMSTIGYDPRNDTTQSLGYYSGGSSWNYSIQSQQNLSGYDMVGVSRPKNMAWNYVFRAA